MSKGLKTTFLVHAIVSLVFGLALYFAAGEFTRLVGWTPYDPGSSQALGAAFLALALSSWLGSKAGSFRDVRVLIQMEIAFTLLGSISSLFQVLLAGGPSFQWVSFTVYFVFAILWFYYYRMGTKSTS